MRRGWAGCPSPSRFPPPARRSGERSTRRAVGKRPQDLFLALTGNYHNRLAPGAPWDAHYEPMGLLLSRLRPDLPLTALDVATTGGTAWICLSASPDSCHVRATRATTEAKERGVSLHAAVDKNGYSGVYRIGPMTASPPAVPVKRESAGT